MGRSHVVCVCVCVYQIEVAVEAAAERPGLVAVAAEVDEPHAREARLDVFEGVREHVYGVVDQRRLRLFVHTTATPL